MLTRFGATQVALPLLVLLALAGCAEAPETPKTAVSSGATSSTAPTSATDADESDLAAALAEADTAKPYSAQMDIRSTSGIRLGLVISGRVNVNGPSGTRMTGRLIVRTPSPDGKPPIAVEEILTSGAYFVRVQKNGSKPAGPWRRKVADSTIVFPDLADYARLLLIPGPSALKGQEEEGGVMATRLSGQVLTEQIRTIEPGLYGKLRAANVDGFACDMWIDPAGRVVRLEQWVRDLHSVVTMSKFRGPVTVKPPIG